MSASRAWFTSAPSTRNRRKQSQVSVRIRAECRKLAIATGRNAFSSKLPSAPAMAITLSLPITWRQTISIASAWVGLTLPGMIEDPGSLDGRTSSPSPVRGPEPSQRMSLANLYSATATLRSAAEARTRAPREAMAANLLAALTNSSPVSAEISAATCSPNPGGEFSPVPTAVPPMASPRRPGRAARTVSAASSSWPT